MNGHVFVLRGDLTTFACDAVLVPTNARWNVVAAHWGGLLPPDRLSDVSRRGWARIQVDHASAAWADMPVDEHGRHVRLIATAGAQGNPARVADTVTASVRDLAPRLRPRIGRVRPLVALPLVGTGDGGFRTTRGALIKGLVPALRALTDGLDVDVALVVRDDRDHQAVQSQRVDEDWPALGRPLRDCADELGQRAAARELSLFLGAGVSVPLGAPSWTGLLDELRALLPAGVAVSRSADPVEEASALEAALPAGVLQQAVVERFQFRLCAPGHLLLAALDAERSVTTNYDRAFETALDGSRGPDTYTVLARQLPAQPMPWLLKLHGDVAVPETIVLTEAGYARLKHELSALLGVVESLLHTGHLLFVGYSLKDPTFLEAAEKVASVRRLADPELATSLATVLALRAGDVEPQPGLRVISMADGGDVAEAARTLEVFLDRMIWAATLARGAYGYLLDPHYEDLRTPEDVALVASLQALATGHQDSPAWSAVAELLASPAHAAPTRPPAERSREPPRPSWPGTAVAAVFRESYASDTSGGQPPWSDASTCARLGHRTG